MEPPCVVPMVGLSQWQISAGSDGWPSSHPDRDPFAGGPRGHAAGQPRGRADLAIATRTLSQNTAGQKVNESGDVVEVEISVHINVAVGAGWDTVQDLVIVGVPQAENKGNQQCLMPFVIGIAVDEHGNRLLGLAGVEDNLP